MFILLMCWRFHPFSGHGLPDHLPPAFCRSCCRLPVSYLERIYGVTLRSIISYTSRFHHWPYFTEISIMRDCRSQWPRGLRRRSAAARLLRLWVRIPPGTWIFVCCECCVLSGRGLYDELITRPEESYRMWCVATLWMRRLWPTGGCCAK